MKKAEFGTRDVIFFFFNDGRNYAAMKSTLEVWTEISTTGIRLRSVFGSTHDYGTR